jgi:hypothetical protein
MKVRIKGHSGCLIEVIDSPSGDILKKSSSSADYSERLNKQAKKQELFYNNYTSPLINFPQVLRTYPEKDGFAMEMEFVPSLDFISYFEIATLEEVINITHVLHDFLDEMLKNCELQEVPFDLVKNKYQSVKSKIQSSSNKKYFTDKWNSYDPYFESKPEKKILIPVGHCHGDLTFSNVLFRKEEKKVIIIDFLDSFIESPLVDMVKIRQDTKYLWSLGLFEGDFDKVKISLVMNKLDTIFDQKFSQYDFYNQNYTSFQLLNLLRIVPYTKDKNKILFLINCLNQITKDTYD